MFDKAGAKAGSSKKAISKTPIVPQPSNVTIPSLAPPPPSPSKDPVRRGAEEAISRRQNIKNLSTKTAIPRSAVPIGNEQQEHSFALPMRVSTFGRRIRPPNKQA
jgi:hypothetical protein